MIKPFWVKPSKPYERVQVLYWSLLRGPRWNSEKAYWYPPKKRWEVHSMYYIPRVLVWREND